MHHLVIKVVADPKGEDTLSEVPQPRGFGKRLTLVIKDLAHLDSPWGNEHAFSNPR